jgi:hypothetical protein
MSTLTEHRASPLGFLRGFRLARPAAERCELCSADLPDQHEHLLDVAGRRVQCACQACAILFDGQAVKRYRRIPRRCDYLAGFELSDAAWHSLGVPIHLAFFVNSTPAGGVVAVYPSPAGATESSVPPGAWQSLTADNPVLEELLPDVEALLVNRVGTAREHYRVGIDECYRLAGLIRVHWQGFSGGAALWDEIARFFAGLRERSCSS